MKLETCSNALGIALCVLAAGSAAAHAQARVTIPPEPKPDQTIHVTATQELSISTDNGAQPGAPGSAQITSKTALGYTQVNGRFSDQNQMEAQITIDRLEIEQALNGKPKPREEFSQLVGQSLAVVLDRQGKLVQVVVPKHLKQFADMLEQMVGSGYGALNALPATALAVGENTTTPSSVPLRIPGSTSRVPYKTTMVVTLRAVEDVNGSRIARFDQRVQSVESDGHQLKVKGSGTIDVNLDKGFISASELEWAIAGSAPASNTGKGLGPVRATVKVTTSVRE